MQQFSYRQVSFSLARLLFLSVGDQIICRSEVIFKRKNGMEYTQKEVSVG